MVTWPSFTIRNILGEAVEGFPEAIWILFWEFPQLFKIVHSKTYYCLAMTQYRHQYRLIEFENNSQVMNNHAIFTAENDDNERQVIRARGERIELRNPVNVSRLYPSLPDLREEVMDETK